MDVWDYKASDDALGDEIRQLDVNSDEMCIF